MNLTVNMGHSVHILSFMTNPIPMNIYRVIAHQKFEIFNFSPDFLHQTRFLWTNIFFMIKKLFLHTIFAHILSFLISPIPMNIYRDIAFQKLTFLTFSRIFDIKRIFFLIDFFWINYDFCTLKYTFCLLLLLQFLWMFTEV